MNVIACPVDGAMRVRLLKRSLGNYIDIYDMTQAVELLNSLLQGKVKTCKEQT